MGEIKDKTQKPAAGATQDPGGQPAGEDIASLAYAIWEEEGRPDGKDLEHWLKAEAQMCAAGTQDDSSGPSQ
jgi:hypothetical protein